MENNENVIAINEIKENQPKAKKYIFKRLEADHLFLMVEIINKIGFAEFKGLLNKDTVSKLVANYSSSKAAEKDGEKDDKVNASDILAEIGISVAVEIASIVLKNLTSCKRDIYGLLAAVSNLSVDEIRRLDAADFLEMLIDFCKKEEFKDFIKVASRYLK